MPAGDGIERQQHLPNDVPEVYEAINDNNLKWLQWAFEV